MVKLYGAREAIATSGGQNDSGLFELSFNDPRYLPFEFMGAVSRWRIELPKENNYFDFDSLTDTVLHLNYTALEGGEALRRAASAAACRKTPGDGWTLFDVRHDFPNAWELFQRSFGLEAPHRALKLRLSRKLFPFLPNSPEISIRKLAVLFETEGGHENSHAEAVAGPCPEELRDARYVLELVDDCREGDRDEPLLLPCTLAPDEGGLYDGMVNVRPRPFRRDKDGWEFSLRFPRNVEEVKRVYIFCGYEKSADCRCGSIGSGRTGEVRGIPEGEAQTKGMR
jgi:Tc toxin complex TcA C-terminal TcB-binding domain